jgi:hypothetical protein
MDSSCICQTTRPNLHKVSEENLKKIISEWDSTWLETHYLKDKITRDELVSKIIDLWANHELVGFDSKPIECLVCCDFLTNGNNLTFECGHKFHSNCIIPHIMHFTYENYQNFLLDNGDERNNKELKYICPQCKKEIYSINISKL